MARPISTRLQAVSPFLRTSGTVRAPAPRTFAVTTGSVRTTFTFDVTTRRLKYDVLTMAGADAAIAAAIHRASDSANGPVVVRLLDGLGRPLPGDATLGNVDSVALEAGKLYIEVTAKSGAAARSKIEAGG